MVQLPVQAVSGIVNQKSLWSVPQRQSPEFTNVFGRWSAPLLDGMDVVFCLPDLHGVSKSGSEFSQEDVRVPQLWRPFIWKPVIRSTASPFIMEACHPFRCFS